MTMNVCTVILMDQDKHLSNTPEMHIVAKFEDVVIPDGQSDMITLLKLAVDQDVKDLLEKHNKKRSKVVNTTTLERTGVEVFLQPIKVEDLVVKIK